MTDTDTEDFDVNDALAELLGYTAEDTLRVQGLEAALIAGDFQTLLDIIGVYVGPDAVAQPLQLISALLAFIDTLASVLEEATGVPKKTYISETQSVMASEAWEDDE